MSGFLDQQAEGLTSMFELREKLGMLDAEREAIEREVTWRLGGKARLLRTENDRSPNRHATKHVHFTEHPLAQSF